MEDFAPSNFVVSTVEERLIAWRELDRLAREAEQELARLGQAAADTRVRDLVRAAQDLREKADREFAAILRAVKHQ